MPACNHVAEDLAALVDGDDAVLARHADHLASCDDCRDARHEASRLAPAVARAGDDHVSPADLEAKLLAALDAATPAASPSPSPSPSPTPTPAPGPRPAATVTSIRRRRSIVIAGIAGAALAAGLAGIVITRDSGSSSTVGDGTAGTVTRIDRAAGDEASGLEIQTAAGWQPLAADATIAAGSRIRTDARTRAWIDLSDGSSLAIDHRSELVFAGGARRLDLIDGRIVTDIAHVEGKPAAITTPSGRIDVIGTRFVTTATADATSVRVTRGAIRLSGKTGSPVEVRAGEEGTAALNAAPIVAAAPMLGAEVAWAESTAEIQSPDKTKDASAGLGALRAFRPGESRDKDWNLTLAKHDVKVRIVGPIARTEITETFENDSDKVLEGVYQFPLPADARIDALELDVEGGFETGAFIDRERATKIWKGVIDKAKPKKIRQPMEQEIIWVPGPWKDPALLDWKRGGRFELRIFPIPAKGARTIKIAYTQIVTPRADRRQYVYPLPHSADGSTAAKDFNIDLEIRGATGQVRTRGYDLADVARTTGVTALTYHAVAFVPTGDLVVDYQADGGKAEVRAWTFAGNAAVAPDEVMARKKGVGLDPAVLDAQRAVAADSRPTAVVALRPELPRWRESKPRDYVFVVDTSQSMVGERATRATQLVSSAVVELDRRDRFTVLACDSECRALGDLRAPAPTSAADITAWLASQTPAGASDVVAAIRAGAERAGAGNASDRERWVIYVGDGFATTGFRRSGDVETAIAAATRASGIRVSTLAIGADADAALLASAARGGGGSYIAWVPGQRVATAAMALIETTHGAALRDPKLELPSGLADVAPTTLPTIRAGEEVLVGARIVGPVDGEIVLRGSVGGQPYEQRYPVKLEVSSGAGNGFVPRLWASLAIEQLERDGRGEDRARIVALSQGYGVMSRHTSLIVLESQAMFDAFGVDRSRPQVAAWTGEDDVEEVSAQGQIAYNKADAKDGFEKAKKREVSMSIGDKANDSIRLDMDAAPAGGKLAARSAPRRFGGRGMIAMRRVWRRQAAVSSFDGVSASIRTAISKAEDALAGSPDSREKHRALVQALSYAGELDRAVAIAQRWLERDRLDPQALGYLADLVGRQGHRDDALRLQSGMVDLDPDATALHDRMAGVYERAGRRAQACGHRIAMVSLRAAAVSDKDRDATAKTAGAAVRCLRALGRDDDAGLVLRGLTTDELRLATEKAATAPAIDARVGGDLVVTAKWADGSDLDLSIITPQGARVSWLGGRTDLGSADALGRSGEKLAVRKLRRGNYLIEISRVDGAPAAGPVRGTIEIAALGQRKTVPFEVTGDRVIVGRVGVTMFSELVPWR